MADENATELGSIIEYSQDITGAEAPPPLPPGIYTAVVSGAELKLSQRTGNKYADITYTIGTEQFPPDFSAIQKDPLNLHYRRLVISDDMRGRYNARKFAEAHRLPTGKRLDLNDLMGRPVKLEVVSSDYEGEPRADIKSVKLA